eukprot:g1627.t1
MSVITINPLHIATTIIVDILGFNKLWGERYERRFLHHFQRLLYTPKRIPLIHPNQKLSKSAVFKLQKIQFPDNGDNVETQSKLFSRLAGGNYSKKASVLLEDLSEKDQRTITEIGTEMEEHFSKVLGKRVYFRHSFVLRYEGADANFAWHYDNEHNSCFRALFLFDKAGTVPDFLYKDADGNIQRIRYEIGDGVIFRGKTTHHCVAKTDDPSTRRHVVSFQYTSEPNHRHDSLCSKLSFASRDNLIGLLPNIFFQWLTFAATNLLASAGGTDETSLTTFDLPLRVTALSVVAVCLGLMVLPQYMPKSIGTGVNADIELILKFFAFILVHVFNPTTSLFFMLYLLITEAILPAKIVNHHLIDLMSD